MSIIDFHEQKLNYVDKQKKTGYDRINDTISNLYSELKTIEDANKFNNSEIRSLNCSISLFKLLKQGYTPEVIVNNFLSDSVCPPYCQIKDIEEDYECTQALFCNHHKQCWKELLEKVISDENYKDFNDDNFILIPDFKAENSLLCKCLQLIKDNKLCSECPYKKYCNDSICENTLNGWSRIIYNKNNI